ncbi:glutamate receptor 2.2-like [Carica papaya]|uniref:glutamate receptor 2.2-like n=1 Tax=Carica papaya TaxID=3649 RepID=UPI000B8C7942|nr:glutamate receptor 2.2-like [Carica papaya]XP_021908748.1 glutamate receptor 2.2-like [Carica papaya]
MMYPADCRNLVFFFFFFFFFLFFFGFCNFSSVSGIREIPIGALLDFSSHEGSMASTCLSMSLSDFYSLNSDYTTRLSLLTRNYSGILDSASGAVDLLNNGVVAILGPLRSSEAAFVIEIGANSHVPVVSFSATSPSLSLYKSPYFIRAAQVDSFQVNAIVSIIQKFGWHQVALVYEDTEFGNGIIPFLTDALLDSDIKLSIKSGIPLSAQDSEILTKLNELKSMWTRVFVVHMTSSIGSRLFALADKAGMMSEGFAWIVTDSLSNSVDVLAPIFIDAMEGVLGIRPFIPKSRNLDNFKLRLKRKILSTHPTMITTEPDIFCLWAYDTIWALADAIERAGLGFINSTLLKPNNKHTVINYVSNLGVSTVGPKLVGEILKTRFRGLSGEFNLVGGQLQPCAYEIFNVIGKGARPIGYWSSEHGITRRQGTSITHLKSVIWPVTQQERRGAGPCPLPVAGHL